MPDALSQGEVDALLAAVSDPKGRSRPAGEVRYYDFLRPERATSVVMKSLADLHEAVARGMGAALSGALRSAVDCRLQGFDQVSWGEFVMGLPGPTCFAVVEAGSVGRFAFEIGPAILYPVMERLLGASAPDAGEVPARPLTEIERRVATGVVEIALGPVAEAWGLARPVELSVVELEANPQAAPVAPPSEMAALATFELTMGEISGLSHLAVPFGAFGEFLGELALALESAGSRADDASCDKARAAAALGRVPVRVEAIAGTLTMTLRELARLSSGDELATGLGPVEDLVLTVGGIPKFRGTEGAFRGRRAVRVAGPLASPKPCLPAGSGRAPVRSGGKG